METGRIRWELGMQKTGVNVDSSLPLIRDRCDRDRQYKATVSPYFLNETNLN